MEQAIGEMQRAKVGDRTDLAKALEEALDWLKTPRRKSSYTESK